MISGFDTPKTGQFAYIHLLLRLSIISSVCIIWDYKSALQDVKRYLSFLKRVAKLSPGLVYKQIAEHLYDSLCMSYTLITVCICIVMGSGVFEARGGAGFYYNLLRLFAALVLLLSLLYIINRIRKRIQDR